MPEAPPTPSSAPRTRDSITDIWGARTPYTGQWPIRVDQNTEEEPERWVQSVCVLCSNGCGMDVGVKGGRMVGVRGRAADHVNLGRLGPKGLHGWAANASADRLKKPLIRRGRSLREAGWDEAMDLIVSRTKENLSRYTSGSLGFYHTGQLFLEEYFTLALIALGGLGTTNLDANTRMCTASAELALRESFGTDGQPGSYADIDTCDALFHIGHNVASQQTVLWARILDRLAGANPPRHIVVDPRRTETARKADLHLAPKVGTNLALMNGLLFLVLRNGKIDRGFVDAHTLGFDKLEAVVSRYPPERVAKICDVPGAELEAAAEILGNSQRLVSTVLQGVYQSNHATAAAVQVNNLHLLRGMIGKPGCTVFQMNGQPSAQNARETGSAGSYPAMRNWQNSEHIREIAAAWNVLPGQIPSYTEPTHAMEIFHRVETGSIRQLWITATNPAVSLPDLPRMRRILGKPDLFLVVQDGFMTETAEFADVVLPAALWGEKTGTLTNAERTVHLSQKAVEPPGEARADFDILLDFARRMDLRDKDGAPLVKWTTPEEAFDGWRAMSAGRPCDYSGMSYAKLTGGSGVRWPCNAKFPDGAERLYTDGVFNTDPDFCQTFGHTLLSGGEQSEKFYRELKPGGRAFLKAAEYEATPEQTDGEYPYLFTTGRVVYQWHTRTKTGRVPALNNAAPEAFIQIADGDAAALGIHEDDWVEVRTRRGRMLARARLGGIRKGHLFMPFHYGSRDHWNRRRAANEGTLPNWDPVSKQPYFKLSAAQIFRVEDHRIGAELADAGTDFFNSVGKLAYDAGSMTIAAAAPTHPGQHIPVYLGMMLGSEGALASAYRAVSERHTDSAEVNNRCQVFASRGKYYSDKLQPFVSKYGSSSDAEGEQLRKAMFGGLRHGDLGLLKDLHDLHTLVEYLKIGYFALHQAGSAMKDPGLALLAQARTDELTTEEEWLNRQIRAIAAQALTVPSAL